MVRNQPVKRYFLFFFALCLFVFPSFSQIIVNSPSTRDDVDACPGYAEEVLLDRWDMNERTDLGWRIFNTLESPRSNLGSISFQNGQFSAVSTANDVKIFILDSAYLGSAMLGKVGKNFPINANKYTRLALRMYLEPDCEGPWGMLFWSKNTIYNDQTTAGTFDVYNGWKIYLIDIPSLGIISGDPWSGLIDSLRMDPMNFSGKTIIIDWIRLVEHDASQMRTITWSGNSGNVDIYLDTNSVPSDGRLGMLAKNVSGNSFSFLAGALSSGNYYVHVAPTGTTNFATSSGYFHVNDTPVVRITKPSAEGSDTDFVTVNFADPWDMNNAADVEYTVDVKNDSFTTLNYLDLAGNSFNSNSVYYGENTSADPNVFFLHFLWRGGVSPIDTSRYHNLVFKMGIGGEQSVSSGSVARVMYRKNDETIENVSQDIVIRHRAGEWTMNKIVCDLYDLSLEPGSPSGWSGFIDCFRIDPHEFSTTRGFFFDNIRITADWTANTLFDIEWDSSDSDHTPSVSLYYDTDNLGYNGVPIVQNLLSASGPNSYTWDASAVPEGKYWIYAVVNDGVDQNRCYATGPVFVDHALVPEIHLSEDTIYLGAERNGAFTSKEKVILTNRGQGSLNWQAHADRSWISVEPTNGTGEGIIEIGIADTNLAPGSYSGQVIVTDSKAWNSPQVIQVFFQVYPLGGDSAPFGRFDTPEQGVTVSANVPVTGWALDDIEVTRVQIKRSSHPDDPPAAIGPDGLVFVGDAVFVKGARPDVEGIYPTYPKADRAGWGYMMLTNLFPNQGNGPFTLYAFAYDGSGHRILLGQKNIICDNANRTKPFGTIDTPKQGGIISGDAYVNFGWALTPQPKYIPTDGSTILVWVDGVPLGNPVYGNYREDIATKFPGYANSDGAVGYYFLDTTQYTNGVHKISWSVEDNMGDRDGIGGRKFEIYNVGGAVAGMDTFQYVEDLAGHLTVEIEGYVLGWNSWLLSGERGLALESPRVKQDDKGKSAAWITMEEADRLELHLVGEGGERFIGWGRSGSGALPEGSTLDEENGVFYWMPPAGFLGEHVLHFSATDGQWRSRPVAVVVEIVPKTYPVNQRKSSKKYLK